MTRLPDFPAALEDLEQINDLRVKVAALKGRTDTLEQLHHHIMRSIQAAPVLHPDQSREWQAGHVAALEAVDGLLALLLVEDAT